MYRRNPLYLEDLDDPFEDSFFQAAQKRKVAVFHGTATRWFWPIVEQGFVYSAARKAWENTSPGTFFAFTPQAVGVYAQRAATRFGGYPIAFVLELPLKLLGKDIDDSETWDKDRNWQAMAAEEIPAQYITGVMLGWGETKTQGYSSYGFTEEIPIKRFITQVQKGKYEDIYGLAPKPDAQIGRFSRKTPEDEEHAALRYLVDLLNYSSLTDHLINPGWARFQRLVLKELVRMPKSRWQTWNGQQWLAFVEEITGEKNEEPYLYGVLKERRFTLPFYQVANKYSQ